MLQLLLEYFVIFSTNQTCVYHGPKLMVNHKVEKQVQRVLGQSAAQLHTYFKKCLAIIHEVWWMLMLLLELPNMEWYTRH